MVEAFDARELLPLTGDECTAVGSVALASHTPVLCAGRLPTTLAVDGAEDVTCDGSDSAERDQLAGGAHGLLDPDRGAGRLPTPLAVDEAEDVTCDGSDSAERDQLAGAAQGLLDPDRE